MKDYDKGFRVSDLAYIRDDSIIYTGEAVLLAALMHSKGEDRKSKDMLDVQEIMRDHNLQ